MDQVAGLALMAGRDASIIRHRLTGHSPEVILAAVDLCDSLFDEDSARALRETWVDQMGGPPAAGETAHTLLMEARLPFGGGSTALELIGSVLQQTEGVWLRIFSVNPDLPPDIRTESLIRLHDQMDPQEYRDYIRLCAEQAEQEGDPWSIRARQVLEWVDAPASLFPAEAAVDGNSDDDLAHLPPGGIADLERLLFHGLQNGWLQMDADSARRLGASISSMDESSFSGPDQAALLRLRRHVDSRLAH